MIRPRRHGRRPARRGVAAVFDRIREVPGLRVVDYASTGDPGFATDDGRSAYGLVFMAPVPGFVNPLDAQVGSAVAQAEQETGLQVGITGYNQLSVGNETNDAGPP